MNWQMALVGGLIAGTLCVFAIRLWMLSFVESRGRRLDTLLSYINSLARKRLVFDAIACASGAVLVAGLIVLIADRDLRTSILNGAITSTEGRSELSLDYRGIGSSFVLMVLMTVFSTWPTITLSKRNWWFSLSPLFQDRWPRELNSKQLEVCRYLAWCSDTDFLRNVSHIYSSLTNREAPEPFRLWANSLLPLVSRDAMRRQDDDLTPAIYNRMLNGETNQKTIIDMALPQDTHPEIMEQFAVKWIGMSALQNIAQHNLDARKGELEHCEAIISEALVDFEQINRARELELALKNVPGKVREIHDRAVNEVFARDLEQLDDNSREVVDQLLTYLEKKYISVPMKMAREILLEKTGTVR